MVGVAFQPNAQVHLGVGAHEDLGMARGCVSCFDMTDAAQGGIKLPILEGIHFGADLGLIRRVLA